MAQRAQLYLGFAGPLAYDDQARAALVQAAVVRTHAQPGVQLHLGIMSNALDGLVDGMVGAPMYEIYLLPLPERPDLLRLDASKGRSRKQPGWV
jgi:hypothetical protein